MIEFELNGKKVTANAGATILEVALSGGEYIPHFCYHKKLSIAANCRMCLVEVEKAPKPLPACATPVTEGMKVHTCSKLALEAQKGVMEFLLINHPLDCPICDQGGECQLQDLAVGYGRSSSRFAEEKRSVVNKDLGALVTTEMTRCIHCSRCVRFTDEVAGFQSLGMSYRNNHVEVMPFINHTVDSEISGNIIDICPVGALTSKPFRNSARSWELSRRKSISAHDSLGSNLITQVDKYSKVVRVLPLENEHVNECWLSDRDRFGYEGLYHEQRVTTPMLKQDNKWINVTWDQAIAYVAKSISGIIEAHGVDAIGVLAHASATTEELYLLQKLMRKLEVKNIDYRLNQSDFSLDGKQNGTQYLGCNITELLAVKSVLLIGSMLRFEQPLLASRFRTAVKKGMHLHVLNVVEEDLLQKPTNQVTCDPRLLADFILQLIKVIDTEKQITSVDLTGVEISKEAELIANDMKISGSCHILLGEIAQSLPNYSEIYTLVAILAKLLDANFGYLPALANEVGADIVGFVPYKGLFNHELEEKGLNAHEMIEKPRKGYVLFNTELEADFYDSALALRALGKAESVIVMGSYFNELMLDYADVILPVAPFTETIGTFFNLEGRIQHFNPVTKPLGETKPAWKVLRVLANTLGVPSFSYESIEDVRKELLAIYEKKAIKVLDNTLKANTIKIKKVNMDGLIRLGIKNMYFGDSIVRRAESLQRTKIANLPTLVISSALANELGLKDGKSKVRQTYYAKTFDIVISDKLPKSCVLLQVNKDTCGFAGRFAHIEINV